MEWTNVISDVETSSQQSQAGNMVDGSEDTCWFSSHGCIQKIHLYLRRSVYVESISILFQNGFQCKKGKALLGGREIEMGCGRDQSSVTVCAGIEADEIELLLEESYDLHRRYCIYRIEIHAPHSSKFFCPK
jgi:hypothetical protein